MAKIIITIEDIPGDKVKTTSNPTFEQMIKNHAAKKGLQASHGYAICALNAIRKAGKGTQMPETFFDRIKKFKL